MDRTRLLVATDFSEDSRPAARLATRLADPSDITVVHVDVPDVPMGQPPVPPTGVTGYPLRSVSRPPPPRLDPEARERLQAWVRESGLAGARTVLLRGEPAREILRLAAEDPPRFVLLGATGRGRVQRVLLGTTATAVVHESPADVLVCRAPGGETEVRRILVATDFSSSSALAAQGAAWIADRTGADLLLVHVQEHSLVSEAIHPRDVEPRLASFNRDHLGGRARVRLPSGRPAHVLREIAQEEDVDLLAVGNHGMGPVQRLVLGSTARAVVEGFPASVLVARRIPSFS